MGSQTIFQNNFGNFLPEIFLASSILVILMYGCFLVFLASSYFSTLTSSSSRLSLVILVISFFICINDTVSCDTLWNSNFISDHIGRNSKIIVLLGMIVCVLISKYYLSLARIHFYEVFVFFLGVSLALCLLISSYSLLSIYLSMELLSLIFYVLASIKKNSGFSAEAGLKYFILGSLASIFFLFGCSLIYFGSGTIELGSLTLLWEDNLIQCPISCLGLICVGSALLFKIGAAPFHLWVVDVYEGSPSLISFLFAVVPKLSVITVLMRLSIGSSLSFYNNVWELLFCLCGVLSLFVGCFGGLGETKIKRLLGFSSIGHIGFICFGLVLGSLEGSQAIFFYMIIYMITGVFLWSFVMHLSPTKKKWLTLVDSVALVRSNPVLGIFTALMLFSMAGIPPMGGFFAKLNIFFALISCSFYLGVIFAVLTSAVSAFYYLRLIKILYFEKNECWKSFPIIQKSEALLFSFSGLLIVFFCLNPNMFFLFSYKMSLGLFC